VKDEDKLRVLMGRVICGDGVLEFWDDRQDIGGRPMFGFGLYGTISGIPDSEGELDDDSYDRFVYGLQACVAEGDAILIIEAGHEKLRSVGGGVTIITSEKIDYVDLKDCARSKAQELLGNKEWDTTCYS
jgi:hypothetical protein